MHYRLLCSLGILLCSAGAHADRVLETLVVGDSSSARESSLAPALAGVESSEQLPGLRIDSAELLQGLPGVQADSRSNYAQDTRVTLRGFGARSAFGVRGIDLQIDGVPLTTPDGQGQLSSVALDGVTRVEVLRGPIAALYGNGAGGVISLQSRAPEENRLGVGFMAGEHELTRQTVQGEWREGDFRARVSAAKFTTDGNRPHASAERQHAGAQVYYTATSGIEAVLRLDTSRDPLLQDPLGLTPAQWREDPLQANTAAELFNTRKSVAHRQLSLTLRQSTGAGRWQTALWRGDREIKQYLGFPGDNNLETGAIGSGGVVDLQRDFYGVSGNYSHDFSVRDTLVTATVGAELATMEDRRRGYVNSRGVAGDLRRDELGGVDSRDLYSILQWQLNPRLQLYGGARHSELEFSVDDYYVIVPATAAAPENPDDSGARDFAEWSSAFGANYALTESWILFASAGRGFETPTLTEMAYQSDDSSGLNLGLNAAENRQREVGLRYSEPDTTEISLTLFGVDSTDEIVVDQSVNGRTTYRNAAGTERAGVELSGQIQLAPAWLVRANANYLDAEYSQGEWEGNHLPGVAKHNHYAQLRWQPLLDERFVLSVAMLHRSKVATADNNQDFAPAATTADLALSSRQGFGDWQLNAWVRVSNLSDKNYVGSVIVNQGNGRSFEPAPERNLNAGIELGYRW